MNQDRFQFVNAQKADTPPEADCWANRSENMRCKSCIWFAAKPSQPGEYTNIGRCRRHAPTMSGYPVVYVNDWCGDHKLNEAWVNKVTLG
jgi:hypothetical protein